MTSVSTALHRAASVYVLPRNPQEPRFRKPCPASAFARWLAHSSRPKCECERWTTGSASPQHTATVVRFVAPTTIASHAQCSAPSLSLVPPSPRPSALPTGTGTSHTKHVPLTAPVNGVPPASHRRQLCTSSNTVQTLFTTLPWPPSSTLSHDLA